MFVDVLLEDVLAISDGETVTLAGKLDFQHGISSVVISIPRSRDSSALEFIFPRSRSWY